MCFKTVLLLHLVLLCSGLLCGLLDEHEDDITKEGEDGVEDDGGDEGHSVQKRLVQVRRVEAHRVGELQAVSRRNPCPGLKKTLMFFKSGKIPFFFMILVRACSLTGAEAKKPG